MARPQNSLPLSVRTTCGRPRVSASRLRTRVSVCPLMARSGTTATASCVASSMIVRHLITRPSARRSNTKPIGPDVVRGVGTYQRLTSTHRYLLACPSAYWQIRFDITPLDTFVGNTCGARVAIRTTSVHPHSRGEHGSTAQPSINPIGSSPLAWGTPLRAVVRTVVARFIPTRVGNTSAYSKIKSTVSVHPHSRGEHLRHLCTAEQIDGSSPLAWGTLGSRFLCRSMRRFIPTRVGNTTHQPLPFFKLTVHPHSRGEHGIDIQVHDVTAGSSPLAWGTQPPQQKVHGILRFIPTRVGNTGFYDARTYQSPVHPHSRGEHGVAGLGINPNRGSSPLAWGTPVRLP